MEKDIAIQTIIEEVFSRYTDGSYIKASMLPDLDLYVDRSPHFLHGIFPKQPVLKMTRL